MERSFPIPHARSLYRITRTMRIVGELPAEIDVAIDGDFEGSVTLIRHRLSTGAASRVTADLAAESIIVRGTVVGNITAWNRVTIKRTARVKGTIHAPNVTLAPGCTFHGRIVKEPLAP